MLKLSGKKLSSQSETPHCSHEDIGDASSQQVNSANFSTVNTSNITSAHSFSTKLDDQNSKIQSKDDNLNTDYTNLQCADLVVSENLSNDFSVINCDVPCDDIVKANQKKSFTSTILDNTKSREFSILTFPDALTSSSTMNRSCSIYKNDEDLNSLEMNVSNIQSNSSSVNKHCDALSEIVVDKRKSFKKPFNINNGKKITKNNGSQNLPTVSRPQRLVLHTDSSSASSSLPDLGISPIAIGSLGTSVPPTGPATVGSTGSVGAPFEIIHIVPPINSRRHSGALSPVNLRSSSSIANRRYAPSHFRSIPELTSSQLNLNRSEQFQASASYALAHCNEEILCYYNRLVSLIGWRPLVQLLSCRARVNWLIHAINWLYVAIIIVLLLSAYLLQFATCFRQDSIFVYDPLILGNESPPFIAYFERQKFIPKSTTLSWIVKSPNSSTEEFSIVSKRYKTNSSTTSATSMTSDTFTTSSSSFSYPSFSSSSSPSSSPSSSTNTASSSLMMNDFNSSKNGVTFRGKIFPIIITTSSKFRNITMIKRPLVQKYKTNERNLLSLFYPFIERYSNVSFHNSTSSHHHENLYRCRGGVGTYYFIPSLLHFIAFISMLRQMRKPETDRFHNLCVVNYILDTKVSGRDRASNKLTSSIRFWLAIGIVSLSLTLFSHSVHFYYLIDDPICFTFLQPASDLGVNILKGFSLFLFGLIDFICIAIFTTYALHCTLNIHFLRTNIIALREKRIDFHEFTKNTEESKTSIDFLNCTHSVGVSILLIHFGTRLLVLLIDLCTKKVGFNLLTATAFVYWIALVIVPTIQAARVTEACIALRHIGHELRARPFCYQSAPYHDLDSLLSYTSTLHMRAKLLLIPVRSSCVATIGLTLVFVFLILGQIDLIQF